LLELFQVDEPYEREEEFEKINVPTDILNNMLEYAINNNIIEDSIISKDLFDTKIMGFLTPRASEVVRSFYDIYYKKGASKATKYFYNMSKALNYIRWDRVKKNMRWEKHT
ncbi:galactose-1-phosphate uridylyltransferase, partial [Coprococcus sp. MSK.21.13]|nr:galactose-1-phosphate uridylyltransferase [Coprococcus sp. MSK.21.13]